MIFSTLKLMLCILLLDYIYANPLCNNKNQGFIAGYEYYDSLGYYKLYTLPSTWGYAWKQCKEDGGHLVVIDSKEERKVVWGLVNKTGIETFIGVHDMFVEGLFFTVKDDPFVPTSYNKWAKDQPNNYNKNQHCVFMDKVGELWDAACEDHYSFICEIELAEI